MTMRGLVGLTVLFLAGNAGAGEKRIMMSVTLPDGVQVKVTQVAGQLASVKTLGCSLGLSPSVSGEIVSVTIYQLDEAGKLAALTPLATTSGRVGELMTYRSEPGAEPVRIVPEKIY
jgi:hypothetical protein